MTQINFDPNKPSYRSKFISADLSDNFQALSRANDLRATQQDPPDLTVRVESGAYAVTSEGTLRYAGGISDLLDTTTGGSPTQKRIFVLELDAVGVLHWNSNGYWVTPPVDPTVPTYNGSRVPICEVTVTYGDTTIVQDQIKDARPMINLGVGTGQALNPGRVVFTATAGQLRFDTSSHFIFNPGSDDILVWSSSLPMTGIPGPGNGLFYRISGTDYTEVSDTAILFDSSYVFVGGEKVVIWKVGLSATPGAIGLTDLSDVSGDQAAAFQAANAPTAINPFLTASGHNLINHLTDVPSLAPVAAHIVTTATGSHKHMASEIQAIDPGAYSNKTDVQGVLDDIGLNVYEPFVVQHYPSGAHGPKVTVNQTTNDNALLITKGAGVADVVNITNSGSGVGVHVGQVGIGLGMSIQKVAAGTALHVSHSSTAEGTVVHIEKYTAGSYAALEVDNSGTGAGILIKQTGAGKGLRIMQSGSENAIVIEKTATDASSAVIISNSGSGPCLYAIQSTTTPSTAILYVENKHTSGRAVRIDQGAGSDIALYLNKTAGGTGNIVEIYNSGTGYDMKGHNGNWWIDKNGNAMFANIPAMVASQVLNSSYFDGSAYFDQINATIYVPKVSSSVLITFSCVIEGAGGNDDQSGAMELRTSSGGGGSRIVEQYPWFKLNPHNVGWDELTLPISFSYLVTPGVIGNYPVYARLRTVYAPGWTEYHHLVLTLQTMG